MTTRLAFAALVVMTSIVGAAPAPTDIAWSFKSGGDDTADAAKFGFNPHGVNGAPKKWSDAYPERSDIAELVDPTIASSGDVTWVATGVKRATQCAGLQGTWAQCKDSAAPTINALVLYAKSGKSWHEIAIHAAVPIADKDLAKSKLKLDPVPKAIAPDAADAAKLFETSFADPKALAASVSARKDVTLLGSAPNEKTRGGAAVAKKLGGWQLAFTVHDGIAAGAVGNVAWVAANVDAKSSKDNKVTSYRVMAIYEKAKTWQLVAVEFSFPAEQQAPQD